MQEVFKAVFSRSSGRLGRLLLAHDRIPSEIPKERLGAKRMQRIYPLVVATITKIVEKLPKYLSQYTRSKDVHSNIVCLEPDCDWHKVFEMTKEELPPEKNPPSLVWFY